MLHFKKSKENFKDFIFKNVRRDYQVNYGANVFGFITQVNDNIIKKQVLQQR
jgi:penicillin-binding protein 2